LFRKAINVDNSAAEETLHLLAARTQSGELKGSYLESLRRAFQTSLLGLIRQEEHPLKIPAANLAAAWGDELAYKIVGAILSDRSLAAGIRARAFSALAASTRDQSKRSVTEFAKRLLGESNAELQGAILATLGKLDDDQVASVVLSSYSALSPDAQPKAIELLTQRARWAKPLFDQIAAGEVNASLLNVNQVQRVLGFKDAELTAAVNKHYGAVRTTRDPARERTVTQMRTLVRGIKGDPHRGIEVYNRVCGQCHKIYGQGQEVGPDITANGRASLEQLLSNVFDPSLVIGSAYQARTVQCTDGRILTGLVAEDSPERIVLKVQGGKLETIPRADVEATKLSELSLMPEGLEKQLQPQEIADLFAFISLDKHPSDPTARPIPSGEQRR
jgi:putative heme-binding domain-containing protein